jgi:hypothetical protein
MRIEQLLQLSLCLLPLAGACKWTEFDDLRDEAWVHATSKPDGSKSNNWGVAIVRGKATSDAGGRLAVFGSAQSRLNEISFDANGVAKQLDEQNLGNIGIANLSIEPIVIADPSGDDFALVTQGSAQQVVVAAGGDSNLIQFIINGATQVDAAAYVRAPAIDSPVARAGRTAQAAQPVIGSGNTLFGTFFTPPESPFNQVRCTITNGADPINIRGLAAVPSPETPALNSTPTDDIAIWASDGNMYVLDGHLFNGARSGDPLAPGTELCPAGVLDIAVGTATVIKSAAVIAPTGVTAGFIPDSGSLTQILPIDGRFAVLHGHTSGDDFLALWDFEAGGATAGALVGSVVAEPGIRSIDLFRDEDTGSTFVVAGYPNAIVDGVQAGKIQVYEIDTATGVDPTAIETIFQSQAEDGQAFGRAVAVFEYNGLPVIAVAANNEVFTYFRTPTLYNTDRRQGR